MSRSVPPPSGALTPARLRQVVDALEEGVAILDAAGVIEFINPRGQEILRVPALEMIGHRLLDFRWEICDADGRPLRREQHPALRAIETREPCPTVLLGMRSPAVGDQAVWVEVSSIPLEPESGQGPPGSLTTFQDVSVRVNAQAALRGSERRFETLVDAVPVGIFHAGDEGCVWTNQAWSEISGQSASEALGRGWENAIHPEDLPRLLRDWSAASERGEPFTIEHRVRRPDGEVRWVLCRVAPLSEREGGTTGFLGSVIDVTEAREADELKDQIIGLVSHELRAPLISIRGGLTMLGPYIAEADADGKRLYEIAVRNAELLERLVTDLLDIERLEAGSVGLDLEKVPVSSLLNEARVLVLPRAEERGVILAAAPAVEATVAIDRDRVLQVLTNVLSNAIKFSETGGTVRLDVTPGDDHVRFAVIDEGRGIPADQLERIFERFVQVRPSDAAVRGGAGLGLAIARAIVTRHGGRIWAESVEGAGATFFFILPTASPGTVDDG